MNAPVSAATQRPSSFLYSPMFPLGEDKTPWKKLDIAGVRTVTCDGQTGRPVKLVGTDLSGLEGPLTPGTVKIKPGFLPRMQSR